jgi:hypothetical protein
MLLNGKYCSTYGYLARRKLAHIPYHHNMHSCTALPYNVYSNIIVQIYYYSCIIVVIQ